jgi:hypothetical protein
MGGAASKVAAAPGKQQQQQQQFDSPMPTVRGNSNKVSADPNVAGLQTEVKKLKTQLAAANDKYQEMRKETLRRASFSVQSKKSGDAKGRRQTVKADATEVVDKTGSLLAVAEAKDHAIFSKFKPKDGFIQSERVTSALRAHGLLPNDLRLTECFEELSMKPELDFAEFQAIKNNNLLMDRALNMQLAIPNFAKFKEGIKKCYRETKHNEGRCPDKSTTL